MNGLRKRIARENHSWIEWVRDPQKKRNEKADGQNGSG